MAGLKENIKEYIDLQKERVILNVADKTSNVVSAVGVRIAYIICALLSVIFLSVSLALSINSLTSSAYLGFLIVSVLYLIITILLYRNGEKWFGNVIEGEMLAIFYKDEDNEKF